MMTDNKTHNVFLYDRHRMEISGISEVESFNDEIVSAVYDQGGISVEGSDLKIDSFSVDSGELVITGDITGYFYYKNDKSSDAKSISRIFKRR